MSSKQFITLMQIVAVLAGTAVINTGIFLYHVTFNTGPAIRAEYLGRQVVYRGQEYTVTSARHVNSRWLTISRPGGISLDVRPDDPHLQVKP